MTAERAAGLVTAAVLGAGLVWFAIAGTTRVPDVVGHDVVRAHEEMERAGLGAPRVDGQGTVVVSIDPEPGSLVLRETPVHVVVGEE
ncbi:PASTA domain-containing protein [Actinotalea sp. AC32]|nr:PASTA domain-containing protein [Actinotalea sp. AC32]